MVVNMEVYKLVDEVADMVVVVISVGHMAWPPEGHERWGHVGPKGRQLEVGPGGP